MGKDGAEMGIVGRNCEQWGDLGQNGAEMGKNGAELSKKRQEVCKWWQLLT